MKKKYDVIRFALKCVLIPAAAVLIIYTLNKSYKKIDDQKFQDIGKFSGLGIYYHEVNIGNLGSSHGACDFSYDNIMNRGYTCFNFANTSQSYNYDLAVLNEFGHYMTDGSVLFIPVSYFSFNNEVINSTEAEAMSIRYYHFLSPENIPDYDPYVDLVTHKFPILSAGEDILQLFPDLNAVLTAHAEESGVDVEEFAKRAQARYSRHFDNKSDLFLEERIEDLYEIIDYCWENNITPVLITTPFSKYYDDLVSEDFLREFDAVVKTIAFGTGINYYDYSHDPRFYDHLEYFNDPDHLNIEGAAYFTDILWNEVEELERFH